jgi:hypothetical protein
MDCQVGTFTKAVSSKGEQEGPEAHGHRSAGEGAGDMRSGWGCRRCEPRTIQKQAETPPFLHPGSAPNAIRGKDRILIV